MASLFLTESDAQVNETKRGSSDTSTDDSKNLKGDRQDTEYEEYYEYDDEEDANAV